MEVSQNCIDLIKQFEGCKLTAYKDSVGVWTIGYGLTNACTSITGLTIKSGTKITQAQAEKYLTQVLNARYIGRVSKYDSIYHFNQNQIDALTSFAYNIGSIDGLTANGTRTIAQISSKIPEYNKAGGVVLAGLTKRRAAEKALFNKAVSKYLLNNVDYAPVFEPTYYANKYADLRAAFGYDAKALFKHFCDYGMKEGRQGSTTFNVEVYKERYTDLKDVYGNNLPAYYLHYCVYGVKEGRKGI